MHDTKRNKTQHSNTKHDKNIIKLGISFGIVMLPSIATPCMTLNVTKLSIATLSMTLNITKLGVSFGIVMLLSIATPCMKLNITKLSITINNTATVLRITSFNIKNDLFCVTNKALNSKVRYPSVLPPLV